MDPANLTTTCQWIADLARTTILDQRVTDGAINTPSPAKLSREEPDVVIRHVRVRGG
jgi:hypothetical protein